MEPEELQGNSLPQWARLPSADLRPNATSEHLLQSSLLLDVSQATGAGLRLPSSHTGGTLFHSGSTAGGRLQVRWEEPSDSGEQQVTRQHGQMMLEDTHHTAHSEPLQPVAGATGVPFVSYDQLMPRWGSTPGPDAALLIKQEAGLSGTPALGAASQLVWSAGAVLPELQSFGLHQRPLRRMAQSFHTPPASSQPRTASYDAHDSAAHASSLEAGARHASLGGGAPKLRRMAYAPYAPPVSNSGGIDGEGAVMLPGGDTAAAHVDRCLAGLPSASVPLLPLVQGPMCEASSARDVASASHAERLSALNHAMSAPLDLGAPAEARARQPWAAAEPVESAERLLLQLPAAPAIVSAGSKRRSVTALEGLPSGGPAAAACEEPSSSGAAADSGALLGQVGSAADSAAMPAPVMVQVASRSRRRVAEGEGMASVTRGAVGVFYPQLYLSGGDCIECNGEMMSRGRFERLAGTATAKWHVSIKVLPTGATLGRWLQQHGLPVLQGKPRKRRAARVSGREVDADLDLEEGDDEPDVSLSADACAHHHHHHHHHHLATPTASSGAAGAAGAYLGADSVTLDRTSLGLSAATTAAAGALLYSGAAGREYLGAPRSPGDQQAAAALARHSASLWSGGVLGDDGASGVQDAEDPLLELMEGCGLLSDQPEPQLRGRLPGAASGSHMPRDTGRAARPVRRHASSLLHPAAPAFPVAREHADSSTAPRSSLTSGGVAAAAAAGMGPGGLGMRPAASPSPSQGMAAVGLGAGAPASANAARTRADRLGELLGHGGGLEPAAPLSGLPCRPIGLASDRVGSRGLSTLSTGVASGASSALPPRGSTGSGASARASTAAHARTAGVFGAPPSGASTAASASASASTTLQARLTAAALPRGPAEGGGRLGLHGGGVASMELLSPPLARGGGAEHSAEAAREALLAQMGQSLWAAAVAGAGSGGSGSASEAALRDEALHYGVRLGAAAAEALAPPLAHGPQLAQYGPQHVGMAREGDVLGLLSGSVPYGRALPEWQLQGEQELRDLEAALHRQQAALQQQQLLQRQGAAALPPGGRGTWEERANAFLRSGQQPRETGNE